MPTDPISNLKNWASLHVQNTEREIAKVMFLRLLCHTRTLDAFSNWFLLVVGASFTLIVPNLASVATIIPAEAIRAFLILLIASSLCGIIEKLFAMKVDMRLQTAEALEKDLGSRLRTAEEEEKKILEAAEFWKTPVVTAIDFRRVVETLVSTYPRWLRKRAMKKADAGFRDPLDGFKDASREFWRQGCWFGAQFLFLIAAFVVVALTIKYS